MIKLEVMPYCSECRDFDPAVEMRGFTYCGTEEKANDTYIRCKYRNRCENIRRYISQQKEAILSEEYDDGK